MMAIDTSTFIKNVKNYSKVFERGLKLKGFQADGLFGNFGYESGGMTTLQEIKPVVGGSRGGFGWAQWTGPRRVAFERFCEGRLLDPTSAPANAGFVMDELQDTHRHALEQLRLTTTRDGAVEVVMKLYEVPWDVLHRNDDAQTQAAYERNLASRIKWAKIAEAARLEQEKADMPEAQPTLPIPPQAPAGGPAQAAPPTTKPPATSLHAVIEEVTNKVVDLAADFAVKKGVPSAVVALAKTGLAQLDAPSLVEKGLLALLARLTKKA